MLTKCGPRWLSRYSDSLRAGRSGDRIPVGERFSAPFQTGPRPTQPPIQFVLAVKRLGRGVNHPPHLAPRLKKQYSYTSTAPLGLRGVLPLPLPLLLTKYHSSDHIKEIGWAGLVERVCMRRYAFRVLVVTPEGKGPLGETRA
jgi:hypothetical protein